jgi:hypothetical protein
LPPDTARRGINAAEHEYGGLTFTAEGLRLLIPREG